MTVSAPARGFNSAPAAHRRPALSQRRYFTRLGAALLFLAVLLVLSPGIGTESGAFGWWDAWRARLGMTITTDELAGNKFADANADGQISPEERDAFASLARIIGFSQRFPRSLLALQVGATLALCGAVFQILFRNPLATPYTLGVASGGSLAALIAFRAGWAGAFLGLSTLSLAAFLGAILIVALVFLISRGARRLTSNELLLAGVTLGLFCSALMMFVTAVSDERETFFIIRWMMGSLEPIRWSSGTTLLPMILPAWFVLIALSRSLNQYRLGEDWAETRGVNVARVQLLCVVVCTLATAGVVAQCGPIGFVGLVVPHIVTLLVGSDCRILLPTSAIAGAAFLILCDWGSQLCMRLAGVVIGRELGSAILPIGVITAIVGVPLFLILLRATREQSA